MPIANLAPTRIGPRVFDWGRRTYVMGIVNVTPDSFSGDGILASTAGAYEAAVEAAVVQARRMVGEGADMLDVGGESTRPGHEPVTAEEERQRVVPVISAIHAALPDIPISVDTSKATVAAAALDAGASLLNDVWGTGPDEAMARLAGTRQVPIVVMHNRGRADYEDFVAELLADLTAALERAQRLGVPAESLIVDPGFGFGKTPEHNLEAMRHLADIRALGHPVLLGTSRKSTLGRILDGAPVEDRLEATLATTALGIASGVDVVRVHDVLANVRAARTADAVVRGGVCMTDRLVLTNMIFEGCHGVTAEEREHSQPFEVDVEMHLDLRPAGRSDDLARTVDYSRVFDICREIVQGPGRRLIESLAEAIADEVLVAAGDTAEEVVVRVRKPQAPLPGRLDHAAVEITRRRVS